MAGFYGADTEQLRSHAEVLRRKAQRIVELRQSLEPLVMNESMWVGTDADSFRQTWTGQTSQLFDLRSQDLADRGSQLEQHADEQDTASGTGGGGGSADVGAGGGDEGGGFSPWGFLKDLAMKGQGLYSKIKSLSDWMGRIPSRLDEYGALAARGLEGLWKQSYLDELFKGGKEFQGAAEKILGKLGIPTSLGNFTPFEALNGLASKAPWLKAAARGIGEILPVADVLLGVHRIGTSDNWYDRTSGILSTAGGALMIAAPFTGPAAPIVGAIGVGLGVVSAGMDLAKLVQQNWGDITSTVGNAANAVTSAVGNVASAAGDAIGNATSAAGEALSNAGSAISDGLGGLADAFGF